MMNEILNYVGENVYSFMFYSFYDMFYVLWPLDRQCCVSLTPFKIHYITRLKDIRCNNTHAKHCGITTLWSFKTVGRLIESWS